VKSITGTQQRQQNADGVFRPERQYAQRVSSISNPPPKPALATGINSTAKLASTVKASPSRAFVLDAANGTRRSQEFHDPGAPGLRQVVV